MMGEYSRFGAVSSVLGFAVAILLGIAGTAARACTDYDVSVTCSPTQIAPIGAGQAGTTTTVTVHVVHEVTGDPIRDTTVYMSASGLANQGGHIHTAGTRPVGTFSPSSGKTNTNGYFTSTYTAGVVGGADNVRARCGDDSGGYNLSIAVPGLGELPPGDTYTLTGAKPWHPSNHYGTNTARLGLIDIAGRYHSEFPSASLLRYNDISLVKGGLFDINLLEGYTDQTDWQPPHAEHRAGTNCDVSKQGVPQENWDRLEAFFEYYGTSYLEEDTHWHVRF